MSNRSCEFQFTISILIKNIDKLFCWVLGFILQRYKMPDQTAISSTKGDIDLNSAKDCISFKFLSAQASRCNIHCLKKKKDISFKHV